MIGNILRNAYGASRSYSVYVPTTELWGLGNTALGQLNNTTSEGFFQDVVSGSTWNNVSVGFSHTMAVRNDGTLWCWGWNSSGQLGLNDMTNRSSPVQVGTLNNWSYVNCGYIETMAVKTDGTLWGWGNNNNGQLGLNDTIIRSSPVQIGTKTNWTSVSVTNTFSNQHSIGLANDGTLWGWGSDLFGALALPSSSIDLHTINYPQDWASGTTTTDNSNQTVTMIKNNGTLWGWGAESNGMLWSNLSGTKSSPVQLGTLTNWSKISSGNAHTMAIKTDGTLWGWGWNRFGYIGQGATFTTYSSPVQIGNMSDWSEISAAGSHTMAIKTDGTLWVWGYNNNGQLGLNNTSDRSSPVQLGLLTNWSKVSAGSANYVTAIKTDGTLWAWGNNSQGQLGDGSRTTRSSPVQIGTLTNWSKIFSASSFTMAIKTDGTLWGWGSNGFGNLGTNNSNSFSSPVQIGTLTNWSSVVLGDAHSMAIKTDGTLWGWGSNQSGVYGIGDTVTRSSPIQLGTSNNWNKIILGRTSSFRYSLVIDNANLMYTAGESPWTLRPSTYNQPNQLGSSSDWLQAVSGGNSTFAIKYDNTLWAWGNNTSGQLGDGTVSQRNSPVQIGTLTNWSKVVNNGGVTLAIKTDGTLWSWGSDSQGLLGLSTNSINRSSPVQIGTRNGWTDISCGFGTNNAAVRNDNSLWIWGTLNLPLAIQGGSTGTLFPSSPVQIGTLHSWSQVSAGGNTIQAITTTNRLLAVGPTSGNDIRPGIAWDYTTVRQIGDKTNWNVVSCGMSHTMAISGSGTLWAWGNNGSGQLGNNSTSIVNSPVQIGTLSDWKIVEGGGSTTYAIKTNNTLWAWGNNGSGQLGLNNSTNRSSPVQVGVFTDWSSISAKQDNAAAGIRSNNTLWTWGSDNFLGALGQGTSNTNRSVPTQVGTLSNWAKVSTSDLGYMLAVKTDGTLWSWGSNSNGQLGNGTSVNRSSPVQIGTLNNWSSVETGGYFRSFAIKTDGTLWVWGYGDSFSGLTRDVFLPNKIPTTKSFRSVSTGGSDNSLAIATDGTLWGWGLNSSGQLGTGNLTTFSSPVQIGTLSNWSQVSAGTSYTMSVRTDGTLWGWGNNASGQIGIGNTTSVSSPVQIGTRNDWSSVDSGFSHTMAVGTGGTLWTWGNNGSGRLGDNTAVNRSSPVQIGTLSNWSRVSAGDAHSVSVKTDGTLWSWGSNSIGQLGLTLGNVVRSSPVQVGTLNDWSRIAAGVSYTMAIKTNGTLWAWGGNSNGQLGDGTVVNRSSPVQIGTLNNWSHISATHTNFQATTLAVKTDGTIWGWGYGNYQFGSIAITARSSPVQIGTLAFFSSGSFGQYHGVALKTDGTLWSWGLSNNGNLGYDQTFTINRSSPVQIGNDEDWLNATILSSISGNSNNEDFTIAIKSNNTVFAWGNNAWGQLGTGDKISRSLVTQVASQYNWVSGSVGNRHNVMIRRY